MKVRIGVSVGGRGSLEIDAFGTTLDALDQLGFDSVWLPETFLSASVDPLVGLAYAAARVSRLKLGSHLVAPGRNPIALAKALAQLDRLSGGRLLLDLVAGINDPAERAAQGLPSGDRTTWFDEHLPDLRRWWDGLEVDGLALDARPAPATARGVAGWAGPGRARARRSPRRRLAARRDHRRRRRRRAAVVDGAAAAAGRTISPEHFGINLRYWLGDDPPTVEPLPRRVVGDTRDVVAIGATALRATIARWVDAGFTKIVVGPMAPPVDWPSELAALADVVVDLQT